MKTITHLPYSFSLVTKLRCSSCDKEYSLEKVNTFATCCNAPLLADYSLAPSLQKDDLIGTDWSMWRYFPLLPLKQQESIVTLGEGFTPIISLHHLQAITGISSVLLKDESHNPTGSFKARGISMAISKAMELGIGKFIIPTAGNAGGALAAYCAKAGKDCVVVMPVHTPEVFKKECRLYGARLVEVDGLINDCGSKVKEINKDNEYFDISTFKEPYRLEGKKTMGYEIAEQLGWELPEIIVYPAGGGTGLVGIWKAFNEMKQMGWISGPLPKMIAVQSENCSPVVAAFHNPSKWQEHYTPKASIANGLAVPYPFAMNLMQQVLFESEGYAVAVSETDIREAVRELAKQEGIFFCPEGAACVKALNQLLAKKIVKNTDRVLIINTGSGYKYMESLNF
jgi:threonine synthase